MNLSLVVCRPIQLAYSLNGVVGTLGRLKFHGRYTSLYS